MLGTLGLNCILLAAKASGAAVGALMSDIFVPIWVLLW